MGLDTMLSAAIAGSTIDFWWGCSVSPGARYQAPWVGKIGASCLEQQPSEPPSVPLKQNQYFLSIDSSGIQIYMVVCWNEYIVAP